MINSYKIPISNTIVTAYNTIGHNGLFDTENNLFCLFHSIDGSGIEPREERQTHPGLTQTYVTKAIKNPTLTIETKDGREAIKWVLEAIAEESNDLPFPLWDYVHPEKQDREQGYTVRQVILKTIEPIGGTGMLSSGIIAGLGWRIILQEDVRQFYE